MLDTERGNQHVRAVMVLKRRPNKYWSSGDGTVLLLNLAGQFFGLAITYILAFLRPRHLLACMGSLFLAIYSTGVFHPFDGFYLMWRHWPVWSQLLLWGMTILNSIGLGI